MDFQQLAILIAEKNTKLDTLKRLEERMDKNYEKMDKLMSDHECSTIGENSTPPRNNRCDNTDNPSIPIINFWNFDGRHNPQLFISLTLQLDKYFTLYDLTEPRKVKFAVMKLTGQASQYSTNFENRHIARGHQSIDTWDRMKQKLETKYMCHHHLVTVLCTSGMNTLKATNWQKSTLQNSMSSSSDTVPSMRKDKLKFFLDLELDLEKTYEPNC